MEPIAYINGKLVPLSEAKISVSDRGFLYGDGLFETLRTYGRKPFLLDAHLQRLFQGASYLRIPLLLGEGELKRVVGEVIEANPGEELYLRITVSRGSGGKGLLFPSSAEPTLVIEARALQTFDRKSGVEVVTASDRRNSLVFIKSLNFLPNLLARQVAFEKGAFEALLVDDDDGLVREGTVSNLFLVQGEKLVTPPTQERVLAGVTRGLVIKLARDLGLECWETAVRKGELFEATELFLTNSLIEIVPITSIDGRKVGGKLEITSNLQAKYADFTRDFVRGLLDLGGSFII